MPVQRHFLDWDGPVAAKAADWLLRGRIRAGAADLGDTLVLAPTLQAGRRLREALAVRCSRQGAALLSAAVATPQALFDPGRSAVPAASATLLRAAWIRVLQSADLSAFPHLMPQAARDAATDRLAWAQAAAEQIEQVRRELAEGGLSLRTTAARYADRLEERDRWNELAALEAQLAACLDSLGVADPCALKADLAARPELDAGVARIVVACIPDPAPLAVQALSVLGQRRAVDILVQAPAERAADFDEWGRPLAEVWAGEAIDLPGGEDGVFLEASPDRQARKAAELLSRLPAAYGPDDIAVGAPDPETIPFLIPRLQALGLSAFDPADAPFGVHPLGRLIVTVSDLLALRAYERAADLLRHPDVLGWLSAETGQPAGDILAQLDDFQNERLPASLDALLAPFRDAPEEPAEKKGSSFDALRAALALLQPHLAGLESQPLELAWRAFLRAVYARRTLDPGCPADREFQQAAALVEETLREFRELPADRLGLDRRRLGALFVRRLREQSVHRERGGKCLDLQGWLELAWEDAPVLIVAGMNEEYVPGGSLSGVFLPDSLRRLLGLRDDRTRFARDVFLLKTLAESRRSRGVLFLIAGKASLSGDTLRPSRLLFRCPPAQLPGRARRLFRAIEPDVPLPAPEPIFKLKPAAAEPDRRILGDRTVSVTALADYLRCPFRFFLKHVLGMQPVNDEKTELDALDFGLLVHAVLCRMGKDRSLWACPDAGWLGRRLAAAADDLAARRYGPRPALAVQVALSSARARLAAAARVQAALVQEGWEIAAVEQKRTAVRQGFTLVGKIDRIDRHRESGAVRIMDYKTSDAPSSPEAQHLVSRRADTPDSNRAPPAEGSRRGRRAAAERAWINLQLPLYWLLCGQDRGTEASAELAYFNLPKAVGDTAVSPWRDFSPDLLTSALKCTDGVLGDLARGRFWPPAERAAYDRDFAGLFLDAPDRVFDREGWGA